MEHTTPVKLGVGNDTDDNDDEDDDDDYGDDDEDADVAGDTGDDEGDYEDDGLTTPVATPLKLSAAAATGQLAPPPQRKNPFPLTAAKTDSALGQAATEIFTAVGYSLATDLRWQSAVAGDATKIKAFRQDVTQQVDLVAFAFMRPSSPFIQVVHSIATYSVRGGGSDLHGKDFGLWAIARTYAFLPRS